MNRPEIPGYGYDADPSRRPGIPRELPPQAQRRAPPPPRQETLPSVPWARRTDRGMPPVFGTAQPPKGFSGAMRAFAYRYPSHFRRHWLVLLAADRVDVLEHRLGRAAAFGAFLVAARLAAGMLRR